MLTLSLRVWLDSAAAAEPVGPPPDWEVLGDGGYALGVRWAEDLVGGVTIPYGGTTRYVAGVGDVDGDGWGDVLVTAETADDGLGRLYVFGGGPAGVATVPTYGIFGTVDGLAFGGSAAAAGDLDGDGFADVIVGAGDPVEGTGAAWILLGSTDGPALCATVLGSGLTGDHFGYDVSGAGDVDGDGYADVIVGAYGSGDHAGAAYLFLGTALGAEGSPAAVWTGEATDDLFGASVTGAGDVDGDGLDDVAIGALGHSDASGRVYIYGGAAGGPSTTAASVLDGDGPGDELGWTVRGAGDVDADGFDDLLVAAPGAATPVRLFRGSASGLATRASVELAAPMADADPVTAIAGVGDVGGDGFDDVLIGATSGGIGRVALYDGAPTGLDAVPSASVTGDSAFGGVVAAGGDLNGDGWADALVGSAAYSDPLGEGRHGRVDVFHGGPTPLDAAAATIRGSAAEWLGAVVVDAGDVNGDGYGDIAVAAPAADAGFGRVYVYPGSPEGPSAAPLTVLVGSTSDGAFGGAVAGVGDMNGDGYGDLVVGAPGVSVRARGAAYVYLGSADGADPVPVASLSFASGHSFGQSVAGLGDVNGDGYADFGIAAIGTDFTEDEGPTVARVYLGGPGGPDGGTSLYSGTHAYPYHLGRVAHVGDVNGDGYEDVLVGGPAQDGGTHGTIWLFYGGRAGPDPRAAWMMQELLCGGMDWGRMISGGDVDGDGYSDVVSSGGCGGAAVDADVFSGGPGGPSDTPTDYVSEDPPVSAWTRCVDASHDLNADGYADLVVGAGAYSLVIPGSVRGLSVSSAVAIEEPDYTWLLTGAGDVDGDGLGDVVAGGGGQGTAGAVRVYLGVVEAPSDDDGDGVRAGADCDDADASVGGPVAMHLDVDGDGYGSPSVATVCADRAGYSLVAGDCDDLAPAVHPGGEELCDGLDDDCDGLVDDADPDVVVVALWYRDADGDGYGDPSVTLVVCVAPEGWVGRADDCDDTRGDVGSPDAWYVDADGDGYGTTLVDPSACAAPPGTANLFGDCDDTDPGVHPGAAEVCDPHGIDEDCDGRADDRDLGLDPKSVPSWYRDADADGYGTPYLSVASCLCPDGYVADDGDCYDVDASIHPGARDVCNGLDDDCDGVTDSAACTEAKAEGCGCASRSAEPVPVGWLLVSLGLVRRRRRAGAA